MYLNHTYISSDNPLRLLYVSPYLTFTGLENSDALVGEHVEHVAHTQSWTEDVVNKQEEEKNLMKT